MFGGYDALSCWRIERQSPQKKSREKCLLIQRLGKEKSCPFQSVRYSHLAFWQEATIFLLGWKAIYQKDLRLVYAGKIPKRDLAVQLDGQLSPYRRAASRIRMWGWSCIFLLCDSLCHCQSYTGAEEEEGERKAKSGEEKTLFFQSHSSHMRNSTSRPVLLELH